MLLEILSAAADTATSSPNLQWLYILIPALFGGYGISSIVSHFTKRKTDAESHNLEGTRLGQDIMEKAMLRLDKEVTELRTRDDEREKEREQDKREFQQELAAERARSELAELKNNALIRYLTKFINYIKAQGGTVPLVDQADEQYLVELSHFAKVDNTSVYR